LIHRIKEERCKVVARKGSNKNRICKLKFLSVEILNQMALYGRVMRDEEAWSSFHLPSTPHPQCSDQSNGFRAMFS